MASDTKRNITLKEVAKEAGVSVGMASRVLGKYGSYSDETRSKVLAAARALEYRPNLQARSLRLGRTQAIGLVVSNIASYHWTTFVRGIEAAARKSDYQVILGTTDDDVEAERKYVRVLRERNVDGLILSPSAENEDLLSKLVEEGLPMVLVESDLERVGAPRINVDNRQAAHHATTYLLGLGHRTIGVVSGAQSLASGRDRLQGYRDALEDAGVPFVEQLVGRGEYRFEDAYHATRRLMGLAEPPTALLVCNEAMTGAALQCLKDLRIAVRDEVSLIGFDDPAWTKFITPAITTVRTPRVRVAELALETLLAQIRDPESEQARPVERLVPTELVVRESCAPNPQARTRGP